MTKKNLVYLWSMRNAAADRAGQYIPYKGDQRYMKSPLQCLVEALNDTDLGDAYVLRGVLFDDDEESGRDQLALKGYGFSYRPGASWFYPPYLDVQGVRVNSLLQAVPSAYRRLPLASPERPGAKRVFEVRLLAVLQQLDADVVVIDGLLVILDALVRPGAPYCRKIVNIHPGITRSHSPYQRRGAHATLDALYGARGLRVTDWTTLATEPVPVVDMTGASFHYVDTGIDSGEVIVDVLNTRIDPEDTILELRWNNFHDSLFPALCEGLAVMAGLPDDSTP